jgi:hypothetical protein
MTLNCRLPQTIKAFEMRFDGVDYLAIEKASLSALYETAVETALEAPSNGVKAKRVAAAMPIHAAPVVMRRAAPMQDAICRELAKRPMTSQELGEVLSKEKLPSIYTALCALRKEGEVITAPDENGIRRNSLKGCKAS